MIIDIDVLTLIMDKNVEYVKCGGKISPSQHPQTCVVDLGDDEYYMFQTLQEMGFIIKDFDEI